MKFVDDILAKKEKIAVVGLGYVGMPIAIAFSKKVEVIGFDVDRDKISKYQAGFDPTNEVGDQEIQKATMEFTYQEERLKEAKFFIVAVPTPINSDKTPNVSPLISASEVVGRNMTKGSIVVYESTVYPGLTENLCVDILEKVSGMKCGTDFKIGYSPERINPGDQVHRLHNIKKIVSGMDQESLDIIAAIYELVVEVGVHRAASIKVAEAAKVVENSQRDINIAFMNELAIVFDRMGIDTIEVVEAMNTKWNALGFTPGLVGGHCIGVDPYYFVYQAEKLGYHSQIISAGRKINDDMGSFVADAAIKQMIHSGKVVKDARVGIFGITFKENCPDTRNSKVDDIIKRLREYGMEPLVFDPIANKEEAFEEYGVEILDREQAKHLDCAIFAVAHREFLELTKEDKIKDIFQDNQNCKNVIIDVKGIFDKDLMIKLGYAYWRL